MKRSSLQALLMVDALRIHCICRDNAASAVNLLYDLLHFRYLIALFVNSGRGQDHTHSVDMTLNSFRFRLLSASALFFSGIAGFLTVCCDYIPDTAAKTVVSVKVFN